MAFIAEDGTGLTNANSMATVAEFDAYFTDRNNKDMTSLPLEQKQALLIQGADYLRLAYEFKSEKLNPSQAMPFPRTEYGLPADIKTANIILASKANDDTLIEDGERRVKKEKVSSLEVVYDENDTQVGKRFTEVDFLVKPYLLGNDTSSVFHKTIRT